jgi:catechol 2,3-dioxygenase-like lactoylglutathione lyase family enzyme
VDQLVRVEPVLMVRDVSRSLAFYAELGFEEVFRDDDHAPRFAMVARDAVQLAMQWHDYVGVAGDRPVLRFPTRDVDALSEELHGLADRTEVTDTSWGTREFHVLDPDGNGLQFYADR